MDRRTFLIRCAALSAGGVLAATLPSWAQRALEEKTLRFDSDLYRRFTDPASTDRPFVRWWWNGDRVKADELVRELRLLHAAGVGGVEINPVKFPEEADPLDTHPLRWLSPEWIDMLKAAFDEAKRLGMTCDLIVGSGWPFGAEYLEGDERGQVMVVAVKKLEGPATVVYSPFELFLEADPQVNNPYPGRTMELVSLQLVPDPLDDLAQITDLSEQKDLDRITVEVPAGSHALYALVKVHGFMQVINGVPGANGPTLNHFNAQAVRKYLTRMSGAIESRIGPLRDHIRALFIDGLELEGANWSDDMREEFIRRRGYDPMELLPLTMYKTGGRGNVIDYRYGVGMGDAVRGRIDRVRYDFCRTQAELIDERFFVPYSEWCRSLGVLSRVQAYGRGVHPLGSSLHCDIPEGESWTTNWLKHRLGEEMGNEDYRRGRGYTMINKYMSSGGHLAGRRTISAEDMTNTYLVFTATLEFLKLGSDHSVFSGITHSVFHGFNYSPPEAPFPGWIRYGAYYNENNTWWPYLHHFMDYKGRLSAVLQQADMYTDIGVLPPLSDMWSTMGMQNEPFPERANVPWFTLVWEAIHKHGNGCDYLSDEIIRDAAVRGGKLCYGPKAYGTVFLVAVERMHPEGLERLLEFVRQGGRLFCVDRQPCLSLGWNGHEAADRRVRELVRQLRGYPDRFIVLEKPADNDFMGWYAGVQRQYALTPYLTFSDPDPFLIQNRYTADGGEEVFFIANTRLYEPHRTRVTFSGELLRGKYPWYWDLMSGERYRMELDRDGGIDLDLGPAESMLIVFDRNRKGPRWNPLPDTGGNTLVLKGWDVGLHHAREGWTRTMRMEEPADLRGTEYVNFAGDVVYRTRFTVEELPARPVLNLGRVAGIAEVALNGRPCGVRWCGRRLYDLTGLLHAGENTLEVKVTTTLGNYMRTLTDNPTAQKWTAGRKTQPEQSMGLIGPVTLYAG